MTARSDNSAALTKQLRKELCKQIRRARKKLSKKKGTPDVHEARGHIKKARATLRVLREVMGSRDFHRRDRKLRNAARPLGVVRDAEIELKRIDELMPRAHAGKPYARSGPREVLVRDLHNDREALTTNAAQMRRSRRRLRRATKGVKRMLRKSALDPRRALGRSYARGKETFRVASRMPSNTNLHRLRKKSKYLALQLRVLHKLRALPGDDQSATFHHLSDLLGDQHDLAVLKERLQAVRFRRNNPDLKMALEHRLTRLRTHALEMAARCYRSSTKAYVRRLPISATSG
jgi:CHAD domain-containing protein